MGDDPGGDIERIRAIAGLPEPGEMAVADANTGWSVHEAVRVVRGVRSLNVIIEQPCLTCEECLQVRSRCDRPMKLDECVTGLDVADRSAETACLKISNISGLTKARRVRDFLVAFGASVVCEDTWGGEITTAALCPFRRLDTRGLPVEYDGSPQRQNGSFRHPSTRGRQRLALRIQSARLGVESDYPSLGDPATVIA